MALVVVLAFWPVAACSDGASEGADAAIHDMSPELAADVVEIEAGPEDTTPPELRDFRVTLEGAYAVTIDLNALSQTRILDGPTGAEATVFVTDDVSSPDALTVELVDPADGALVPGQTATFANGLWRVSFTLAPGMVVGVRVADEAGNDLVGPTTLTIPTMAEAAVGTWEQRFYDDEQLLDHAWTMTIDEDGGYLVDADGGQTKGLIELDDDTMTLSETSSTGGDTDDTTVERVTTCAYHLDGSYLVHCPWEATDDTTGVAGEWARTYTLDEGQGPVTVTDTLVLGDDGTWTETTGAGTTTSGTYQVVPNENYVDNFGDFLVVTTVDTEGSSTSTYLYLLADEQLLLSPWIRL